MIRTSENIREYWERLNRYFENKKQEKIVEFIRRIYE